MSLLQTANNFWNSRTFNMDIVDEEADNAKEEEIMEDTNTLEEKARELTEIQEVLPEDPEAVNPDNYPAEE
jgi:hypothetical protein